MPKIRIPVTIRLLLGNLSLLTIAIEFQRLRDPRMFHPAHNPTRHTSVQDAVFLTKAERRDHRSVSLRALASGAGRSHQESPTSGAGRTLFISVILSVVHLLPGCQATPKTTFSTERPSHHTVTTKHFVIQSDVRLEQDNVLVTELEALHAQVFESLRLPEQRDAVNVYLFSDEASYRFYMHTTWRDLPPRRAYFVGTNRELAVYSFISPQVMEDLRHEFTHGLLHATLQSVPLWLDEGLAEYFEVSASTPGAAHAAHLRELRQADSENWSPNLYRLEMISDFRDLTQRDYAECWAWVHFMLNSSDEASTVLLMYLEDLQTTKTPRRMLTSLESAVSSYANDLQTHVSQLQATQAVVGDPAAFGE